MRYVVFIIVMVLCGCASGGHKIEEEYDSGDLNLDKVNEANEHVEIQRDLVLDEQSDSGVDSEVEVEEDSEVASEVDSEIEPEENTEVEPEEESEEESKEEPEEESEEEPEEEPEPDSGFDAGTPDSGEVDSGDPDSGDVDAGTQDSGEVDSSTPDSGEVDSSDPDSGDVDAGTPDSGELDSGDVDAGDVDSGEVDSGPEITCSSSKACNPIGDEGTQQQVQSFASVETRTCTDGVDEWDEDVVCDYSDECWDKECKPCFEEHRGNYTTLEFDGGDELAVDCIGCKCSRWWRVDNAMQCPNLLPKLVSFEPGFYLDLTMSFQVTVQANGTSTIKSTSPGTVVTEHEMSDFEYEAGHSVIFDLWVVGYVDGQPFEVNANLSFVCL